MFLNERLSAIDKESCIYTSCYCEENIWHLCQRIKRHVPDQFESGCHVVFISNPKRVIPLWAQKVSKREDGLVFWDYHVVLIQVQVEDGSVFVFDLDTALPFPCPLADYYSHAIQSEECFRPRYRRYFRVISGGSFLAHFASDRSHMLNDEGHWNAPPPSYPPIQTETCSNNLDSYISMSSSSDHFGRVFDLGGFYEQFGLKEGLFSTFNS